MIRASHITSAGGGFALAVLIQVAEAAKRGDIPALSAPARWLDTGVVVLFFVMFLVLVMGIPQLKETQARRGKGAFALFRVSRWDTSEEAFRTFLMPYCGRLLTWFVSTVVGVIAMKVLFPAG